MRYFISILLFLSLLSISAQNKIDIKDTYAEDELIYDISTEKPYTGTIQKKRKNGHIVYELECKKGKVLEYNLFFNGKKKRLSNKTVYNKDNLNLIDKEYFFNLNGDIYKVISYDKIGKKSLIELFKNKRLLYSCQYSGKKKHGKEFSFNENGVITCEAEYENGRKKA